MKNKIYKYDFLIVGRANWDTCCLTSKKNLKF